MRDQYKQEMNASLQIGAALTMIIFSLTHQIFDCPGEVIAFFAATWMIAAYVTWTLIILRQKCRDAWQSNHGDKKKCVR